ncbi:hypothetical protein JT05_08655 [Desulfosporosinus sp. Tol-M]|nr:hypothetical protein JT05_08655 [Desulfosporosinus sp. Tol-M]
MDKQAIEDYSSKLSKNTIKKYGVAPLHSSQIVLLKNLRMIPVQKPIFHLKDYCYNLFYSKRPIKKAKSV